MRPNSTLLSYAFAAALLCAGWEFAASRSEMVRLLLSSPSRSVAYAGSNTLVLAKAFAVTGVESLLGLALATALVGIAVLVCLYWEGLRRWIVPPIVISQVVPLISLAPFFIMLLGFGAASKIAMATTICFFPLFVNLTAGIRNVPPAALDLAYLYGFSRTKEIFSVLLPYAVPSIFAGLRVSATLAVIGAIVAEFNGAELGLGKNLFLAAKRLEPELMMVSLALASVLGGALYSTVAATERRFGFWYQNPKS